MCFVFNLMYAHQFSSEKVREKNQMSGQSPEAIEIAFNQILFWYTESVGYTKNE